MNSKPGSSECPPNDYDIQEKENWKYELIYQIYPRSFCDSNNDGIGDIPGIISKLDYLADLGVTCIWLSPVYKSPMKDFGYDVSDFYDIDPIFGNLSDMDTLIAGLHKRNIKLLMDFIPNHCSDEHEYFKESRKSRDNKYADFFVWHDGVVDKNGKRCPPNNWITVFGGSSWQWVEERQQFYYHAFHPGQPDFNFLNPKVREEMKAVLRFWLERGVDGFRVDAVAQLGETTDVVGNDEPPAGISGATPDEHIYYKHDGHTTHQPLNFEVIKDWDDIVGEFTARTKKPRFLIHEVYHEHQEFDDSVVGKYYSPNAAPFNFSLLLFPQEEMAEVYAERIDNWMTHVAKGRITYWVLGNHDQKRIVTRAGGIEYAKLLNLLILTLPGNAVTYQGEEYGAKDGIITFEQCVDPWGRNYGPEKYMKFGRDPARTPILWSKAKNAGFSQVQPWLPVHPDYQKDCIEVQQVNPASILSTYRTSVKLRKEKSLQKGSFRFCHRSKSSFAFVRQFEGEATIVVCNFAGLAQDLRLEDLPTADVSSAKIIYSTEDANRFSDRVTLSDPIHVLPYEGLVLKSC